MKRLQLYAMKTGATVTYCAANIKSRSAISLPQVYQVRYGQKNVKGDAIIPLVPGAPLMLTKNVDPILGKTVFILPS